MPIGAIMGVAFKALVKVKASGWRAMSGAFQSVRGAVDPMTRMASTLRIISPILKVINALFKFFINRIMVGLMPAMRKIIDILLSPETLALINELAQLFIALISPLLDLVILVLPPLITIIHYMVNAITLAGKGFIWFINLIIGGINTLLKLITFGVFKGIPKIPSFQKGTPFVNQTGLAVVHRGEEIIPANKRGRGDNIFNIDLRNAVVDNVDRLFQRLLERVIVELG